MISFNILAHSVNINYLKDRHWMVSRKYNGLGFIWDGGYTTGKLCTYLPFSTGKSLVSTGFWHLTRGEKLEPMSNIPDSIIAMMPVGVPMQGEIWCDDDLQYVNSTVKDQSKTAWRKWSKIKLIIYNYIPLDLFKIERYLGRGRDSIWYENKPYSERINQLNSLNLPDKLFLFPQVIDLLDGFHPDLHKQLTACIDLCKKNTWEGLMFQNICSLYEQNRSYTLLKYKPEHDMEAVITGFVDGKTGRVKGLIGAISAQLVWDEQVLSINGSNGDESLVGKMIDFTISGLQDYERVEGYYKIGQTVTVKFPFISKYGVPQQCNFRR